jgi:hypothetical protein
VVVVGGGEQTWVAVMEQLQQKLGGGIVPSGYLTADRYSSRNTVATSFQGLAPKGKPQQQRSNDAFEAAVERVSDENGVKVCGGPVGAISSRRRRGNRAQQCA